MTRTTTDALQRLKTQRQKLDVRIQHCEDRDKAKRRRQELQRKILVGSYVLEQSRDEGHYAELVAKLDSYLTRDSDRKLFNLPPQAQDTPTTAEVTSMNVSDNGI